MKYAQRFWSSTFYHPDNIRKIFQTIFQTGPFSIPQLSQSYDALILFRLNPESRMTGKNDKVYELHNSSSHKHLCTHNIPNTPNDTFKEQHAEHQGKLVPTLQMSSYSHARLGKHVFVLNMRQYYLQYEDKTNERQLDAFI